MQSRWTAVATYKRAKGVTQITHNIDELEQLHDLIEAGPSWDALIDIRIVRNGEAITLEEAEAL